MMMIILIVGLIIGLTIFLLALPLLVTLLQIDINAPTKLSETLTCLSNIRFAIIDTLIPISKPSGIITKIYVFPIKSCSHLTVDSWKVDEFGLKHDRQYMFAYWNGSDRFEAVTLRNCARLSLVKIRANLEENWFEISYPRDESCLQWEAFRLPCEVDSKFIEKNQRCHGLRKTNLWGVEFDSCDIGNAVPESFYNFMQFKEDTQNITLLFTPAGKKVKTYHPKDLSRMRSTQFHDYFPFHIIDNASIRCLNQRLKETGNKRQVGAVQFRPNFVLDGVPERISIDDWYKVDLKTTDGKIHKLTTGNRCPRCTIPDVELATGKFDKTHCVSRILREYRRIDYRSPNISFLGHYLIHHDSDYRVCIGDEFYLRQRKINLYRYLK